MIIVQINYEASCGLDGLVVFFKQKTAYDIQYGLVGSEMCIRDSRADSGDCFPNILFHFSLRPVRQAIADSIDDLKACLLYTSDAADERSSVDLGGRRIIKKKKKAYYTAETDDANTMKEVS